MRVSGQLLHPGYSLDKSEWGPQAVWTLWRRERSLHLPGTEPRFLGCPASSQVTILTELPRLGCKGTITQTPLPVVVLRRIYRLQQSPKMPQLPAVNHKTVEQFLLCLRANEHILRH
jgi:hypothetical protein